MNKKPALSHAALRALTAALLLTLSVPVSSSPASAQKGRGRAEPPRRLSAADDAFLEDLSRRAFRYFLDHADPETGLVLDRARATGEAHPEGHPSHRIASSAATGFGLTALCVGAARGWVTRAEAVRRTLVALRFFAERAPRERGWFLHWMDARTGERRWRSEYSSIDTTLLLGGVLTARRCYGGEPEVARLAAEIYGRVDFPWMLADGGALFSHGWRPEDGFIKHFWDSYSEHMMLQLLGVGSPTRPVRPGVWRAWARKRITYAGLTYLNDGPLFTHQFSHAWVDFRGWREGWHPFTDYFENSVKATRAHRRFCVDLSGEFPGYTEDVWGITASDSARGYVAWGGPPRHPDIDGTVVPCAAAGSLMFAPDITLRALRTMKEQFGGRVYGRYGFADAFHPTNGWTNPDVIGIDLGITILSAENLRTGRVWEWFMANEEIPRAMRSVGLRRVGRRRGQ
jgi:hypothetical protein